MTEETVEEIVEHCPMCGAGCAAEPNSSRLLAACSACLEKYPADLIKACSDPFDYALRLRTGEMIFFEYATVTGGDWVLIRGIREIEWPKEPQLTRCLYPPTFERGVSVRLSEIVWIADAPHGS